MAKKKTTKLPKSIKDAMNKTKEYLKDPKGLETWLQKTETSLKDIPGIGEEASKIPLTVSMLRSYITGEYANISPKVLLSLALLILHFLRKRHLIPDKLPIVSQLDSIASVSILIKAIEPELNEYAAWRMENAKDPDAIIIEAKETATA